MPKLLERSDFLRIVASGSAALVLGLRFAPNAKTPIVAEADAATGNGLSPNAWVTIAPDETITVMVSKAEMGQGVATGLPTILADELDVAFDRVKIILAPAGPHYADPIFGDMTTGGSLSTGAMYPILRQAGATARAMLVAAAAKQWKVDPASLTTANGVVTDPSTQRTATYGSLAAAAATLPVPTGVALKTPDKFTLIGHVRERVDLRAKTRGQAEFGIDVRVPGMLYAAVARPPVFGGRVARFDATKAKAVQDVQHVVQISSGVAVVATNTWSAVQGVKALDVAWDDGPNAGVTSASLLAEAQTLARTGAAVVSSKSVGDVNSVRGTRLEAEYYAPFLSHAPMEPMNATADVRADSVMVWAPTQVPTRSQTAAAKITGLPIDKVTVRPTYLGGGFGRRLEVDYVEDAVEVSKAIGGPVKVQYTREDDVQHDFYRPMGVNRISGVVADGKLVALSHTVVTKSIARRWAPGIIKSGVDRTALYGADDIPYAIPNFRVAFVDHQHAIPVGFMRAPGANINTFVTETFLDQLAHTAGKDPVAFRLALLEKAPRAAAVLKLAAGKANWGQSQSGIHQGVAMVLWNGTVAALVADVSMNGATPKVHRAVFAVDCGTVINPDIVVQQSQGSINYGLSMAMTGRITIDKGRVQQNNFYDYTVLKLADAPRIEVHVIPSTENPTGIGELGTAPIAPAIANAIFKGTGKKITRLPFNVA